MRRYLGCRRDRERGHLCDEVHGPAHFSAKFQATFRFFPVPDSIVVGMQGCCLRADARRRDHHAWALPGSLQEMHTRQHIPGRYPESR